MNKLFLLLLLLFFNLNTSAQGFYLKIIGQNEKETKTIDSIGYQTKHLNTKSVFDENNIFYEKLTKQGYIETPSAENYKLNDSTFYFKYSLGKKIKTIHIYIGNTFKEAIPNNYTIKQDSVYIHYNEAEEFLESVIKNLEKNGFAMAKAKFSNLQKRKDYLITQLTVFQENKRQVNDIIISGYPNFPKSHKKQLIRNYKNKVFNQKNIENLYQDIEKFRFAKQIKYPEILFTKDSTKVYVYLEKNKNNSFDGFIGFTNSETKKLILSGYLDLNLNNILNSGEKLALYWKSNGQSQITFNANAEIPYIFKSPLGIKTQLNIFKQDSTFQNTKTAIDLGYYFSYNKKVFLGYQATESSNTQNNITSTVSDFNNSFTTTTFEFNDFKDDDFLFPEKTYLNARVGVGKREAKFSNNNQQFGSLTIKHNFYINPKNIINLSSQNYYLKSVNYFINELERFGGAKSIRGFNENTLQGNTFSSLLTEYRYVLSSNTYVHTITDFGFIKDNTSNTQNKLLGIGLGFGFLSKNGLFNIMYANGSTDKQSVKLSNSIVHISFKAVF